MSSLHNTFVYRVAAQLKFNLHAFFSCILGLELRTYTLSHSTSPLL
jgi:hypothetical protein